MTRRMSEESQEFDNSLRKAVRDKQELMDDEC